MNERKEETAVFENRQLENLGPKQVKAIRGGLGGMFAVWRGTAHAWGELWQLPGQTGGDFGFLTRIYNIFPGLFMARGKDKGQLSQNFWLRRQKANPFKCWCLVIRLWHKAFPESQTIDLFRFDTSSHLCGSRLSSWTVVLPLPWGLTILHYSYHTMPHFPEA